MVLHFCDFVTEMLRNKRKNGTGYKNQFIVRAQQMC